MNKVRIQNSFNRSSQNYNTFAFVSKEIGSRLIERALHWRKSPKIILDLGSGPGTMHNELRQAFPKARIIELDLAFNMLNETSREQNLWQRFLDKRELIQGDMDCLPLQNQSIDMIFSNCAIEWSQNHDQLFREMARILAPDGGLFFSTFGPDTLQELRQAWDHVDDHAHIHDFPDMHPMGDLLLKVGFHCPVMAQEHLNFNYPNFSTLMKDLKNTGVTNLHQERCKGLLTPQRLKKVESHYFNTFVNDGLLPCTVEVIFGHAVKRPAHPTFRVNVKAESVEPCNESH